MCGLPEGKAVGGVKAAITIIVFFLLLLCLFLSWCGEVWMTGEQTTNIANFDQGRILLHVLGSYNSLVEIS